MEKFIWLALAEFAQIKRPPSIRGAKPLCRNLLRYVRPLHPAVPRYLAGDDDSGEERNAKITYKLFAGRTYVARLRLFHPDPTGKTSLIYY